MLEIRKSVSQRSPILKEGPIAKHCVPYDKFRPLNVDSGISFMHEHCAVRVA